MVARQMTCKRRSVSTVLASRIMLLRGLLAVNDAVRKGPD
jgi:hypothetical protein